MHLGRTPLSVILVGHGPSHEICRHSDPQRPGYEDEKTEFTNTINKSQDEAGYKKEKRQARGWGLALQCCSMYHSSPELCSSNCFKVKGTLVLLTRSWHLFSTSYDWTVLNDCVVMQLLYSIMCSCHACYLGWLYLCLG